MNRAGANPRLEHLERDGTDVMVDPEAHERGVVIGFGSRLGGVSAPPFASLNVSVNVGDDPASVADNRERLAHALGLDPASFAFVRQRHGPVVVTARRDDAGVVGEGDGLVTTSPGPALCILTADCAPVVLEGARGVATLHAGWRGLVAGVLGRGVAALGEVSRAWVGPCIHACCYEVGPEVVGAFERAGLPIAGRDRVDVAEGARAALRAAGVDRVTVAAPCTSCDERYYSYRRDGDTGRQGNVVALVGGPNR